MTPSPTRQQSFDPEPCLILDWDSQWWGVRTARVLRHIIDQQCRRLVDDWCRAHDVQLLYYLCPATSLAGPRIVEDGGYRLMDVRVTMSMELLRARAAQPNAWRSFAIRPSDDSDLECMQLIAESSYHDSRFFADPRLTDDRCSALYRQWIANDVRSARGTTFVAELKDQLAGYISCKVPFDGQRGSISLLAVKGEFQRQGIGSGLVHRALEWFSGEGTDLVEVVTQARNIGAQRLYGTHGFSVSDVGLWFHKWYST